MNIPNSITVARIALCPLIAWLAFSQDAAQLYVAFVVFVFAALSDVWDGHLARTRGWTSDTGRLLDPIADKLLMASGFIPFYFTTRRIEGVGELPWWGELPTWVLIVVFGRELFVTLARGYAARRGTVIAAGTSGKRKALAMYLFIGSVLLWYALMNTEGASGWDGAFWRGWQHFHGGFLGITLALTVFLTVFSLGDYIWRYRSAVTGR